MQFGYDANHNITRFQDKRGNASTFSYNTADGSNSLAWEQDAYGSRTTYTYGASSTTITDANGRSVVHTYDAYGHLSAVTDALGLSEYYTAYDAQGNLLTAKDPTSATVATTYNSHNRPLTKTDALSNKTTLTYDGQDNLLTTAVSSSPGAATAFSTSSKVGGYTNGLPTTFTDAYQYQSSVAYDASGNVTSATDANNITASATFNALGWKLTSTDALKRVTRYTYDAWGRLVVVTAPDGTQTGTAYDANGNVVRAANADAYAAAPLYAVHCCGNPVGRFGGDAYASGGSGSSAAPSADLSGAADPAPVALYTTQRGGTFTYTFPGLTPGQLYTLRLHFAESGYTAPGQRLFNVDINGGRALSAFDIFAAAGANNKAVVQEFSIVASGSGQIVVSFTPGAAGLPVCSGLEVLPYVHTVTNNYDADDRVTSTIGGTGSGNGDIVSYTYDGPSGRGSQDLNGQTQWGLLSRKTDGNGHGTTYTYTARNEPYQSFYPDNTSEGVAYDANGNLTVRAKGDNKIIGYAYDAADRLTDVTYPTLPAVHFDYDAGGRRTHMHDGNGDTTWTFGDGLHLTRLQSGRGTVLYDYYLTGPRWHMTAPGVNPSNSLAAYTYSYDPGLRLTGLQNPFGEKTTFAYNDDGTVQKKALWNGAYTSYWYDPASGQMTDLQYAFPALGGSYGHHYTYTPAGSLLSRSEGDGGTNSFTYDGLDQLTSEVRTGPVPFLHSYTYDHNGNRLTQTVNGSLLQSFTYDAHDKLTGGLGESESYDANGNLLAQTLNGQTTRFGWDDEDRLTSQSFSDGHSDTYSYTGLGMRLRKNDPTGNYWYDADGVSPASPVLSDGYSTFTPGISEINGSGSRFYLADAQGNSRGLLDGSQNNPDGYNWDAFGNSVSRLGTNPTAFAWNEASGYQTDNDSGLKLLGHRYYDSRTGRFISQDPAGAGSNWYGYCGNDPMNEVDPSGLVGYDASVGPYKTAGEVFGAITDSLNGFGETDLNPINTADTSLALDLMSVTGISDALSGIFPGIAMGQVKKPDPNYKQVYDDWEMLHWSNFPDTLEQWHDIFVSQSDIGRWEAFTGGSILAANKTAINPSYVPGMGSLLADRNPWVVAAAAGLSLGGAFSYAFGSLGAALTDR